MSEKDTTPSHYYRHFDGVCWPAHGQALADLQWNLRYGGSSLEPKRLIVASIIDAYAQLINMSAKRRNEIIRELRKGPGIVK